MKEITNFTVGLTNNHPLSTNPVPGNYTVCGRYPGTVCAGGTVSLQCSPGLSAARYVIIQIPADDYISLCEVEVYSAEG